MNPLAKRYHFGHVGGSDPNIVSDLNRTVPTFTGKNRERQTKLSQSSSLTLRELITDGRFELDVRTLLIRSDFLFGDSINEDAEVMLDSSYKCFIGLENVASFSRTWRGCFPCPLFNWCPFLDRWSVI